MRFTCAPSSLRNFAKNLAMYADEARKRGCEHIARPFEHGRGAKSEDLPADRYHEADNPIPSDAEFKANLASVAARQEASAVEKEGR